MISKVIVNSFKPLSVATLNKFVTYYFTIGYYFV